MKKEVIIAGIAGVALGLLIMHVKSRNYQKAADKSAIPANSKASDAIKTGADGDFVVDNTKKVWNNMLGADGEDQSNMMEVQGSRTKVIPLHNYADGTPIDPKKGGSSLHYPKRASNMLGADAAGVRTKVYPLNGARQWPDEKT